MLQMYSLQWFDTFAATVPESATQADLVGITSICPPDRFPRLLELGCGSGRVAGPLANLGYQVVGIDVNPEVLRVAHNLSPGPQYIALDQRHVGRMNWQFDAAVILWNSLGFVDRETDLETLAGQAHVLRPGGKLLLDLYHPGWLEQHQHREVRDPRGAVVSRWLENGRCYHEIRYPDGGLDQIEFNVYLPEEMQALAAQAGMQLESELVWWSPDLKPSSEQARYQLVFIRP